MNFRPLSLLAVALLATPAVARADADWFASLYTSEGVELRADERVFALYAVLNAMGYDEAPLVRRSPVALRELHPVRAQLRKSLQLDSAEEQKLNAFFDAHPLAAEAYGRQLLATAGPPGFEPAGASELKGVEALVADAYARRKLGELFAGVQDEYRSALKSYHPVVDAPVGAVRRLLKLKEDEPPRIVLVVNLLDGRGKSWSASRGEELFVVLGPSRTPDLFAVAREVARARLQPVVAQRGATAVKAVEGPEGEDGARFAGEVYARAFAAAATKTSDADLEQLSRGAYAPVRELTRAVEGFAKSDKPLDAFIGETVALALRDAPKKGAKAK